MSLIKLLARPALLIIDMQEEFRDVGHSILRPLNGLSAAYREQKLPVVFTRHGHADPQADALTDVLVDFIGAESSIKKGSAAWQLMPELDVQPGDSVIDKCKYSAFQGTTLEADLRSQGVETVVIGGCITNMAAFDLNFKVIVLEDGTATRTPELQHGSLRAVRYALGPVLSCQEAAEATKQMRALLSEEGG